MRSQSAGASITAATVRLKSTVIGPDEKQQKRKDASEREMRECSPDPLRTFLLHTSISVKCPCKIIASTFALFSVIDKLMNNLPLFLLDVNVYESQMPEAPFQCTRRNQTP